MRKIIANPSPKSPRNQLDPLSIKWTESSDAHPLLLDERHYYETQQQIIDHALSHFREIDDLSSAFAPLPKSDLPLGPLTQGHLERLALLAEWIRRERGITLNSTQWIALLAVLNYSPDLKGRVIQVQTGEGKSILLIIIAGFYGTMGHSVDIVTSSGYLAERDQYAAQNSFKNWGLSSSCATHPLISKKDFSGAVVWGTSSDFEFGYLIDCVSGVGARRNRNVVLVDEADNLFIDKQSQSARIASGNHSFDEIKGIFSEIWAYVKSVDNDDQLDIDAVRHRLAHQSGIETDAITDFELSTWIDAAWSALHEHQRDIHYTVDLDPFLEMAHQLA